MNKIFTENTDDWEDKTLDELCYIYIGKTPNRAKKIFWDKNLITDNTWLSIADLKNTKNKFVYSSKEQISDKGAEISKIVKKGTLLLSFKLTIGRVAFAGKDLYTNEAIAQLPIKEDKINVIDKNYLFYYLQFFDYENILKGDIKVKGKTLNKKKLAIIPILFPPASPPFPFCTCLLLIHILLQDLGDIVIVFPTQSLNFPISLFDATCTTVVDIVFGSNSSIIQNCLTSLSSLGHSITGFPSLGRFDFPPFETVTNMFGYCAHDILPDESNFHNCALFVLFKGCILIAESLEPPRAV